MISANRHMARAGRISPLVSLFLAIVFYTVQPHVAGIEPLLGLAKYLAYIKEMVAH
jgi:hypothetical protein